MSTFLERWSKVIANVSLDTSRLRWRHKARGTRYKIIGEAQVQTSHDNPLTDYEVVVVYQGDDGELWVRRHSEFMERFEPIPPRSRTQREGTP